MATGTARHSSPAAVNYGFRICRKRVAKMTENKVYLVQITLERQWFHWFLCRRTFFACALFDWPRNFVTELELVHLKNLATGPPFPFSPIGTFETEMRRLIVMGLVRWLPGHGFGSKMSAADGVRNHLEISDEGRDYLRLRDSQDKWSIHLIEEVDCIGP
jgi:hypothetical protein